MCCVALRPGQRKVDGEERVRLTCPWPRQSRAEQSTALRNPFDCPVSCIGRNTRHVAINQSERERSAREGSEFRRRVSELRGSVFCRQSAASTDTHTCGGKWRSQRREHFPGELAAILARERTK